MPILFGRQNSLLCALAIRLQQHVATQLFARAIHNKGVFSRRFSPPTLTAKSFLTVHHLSRLTKLLTGWASSVCAIEDVPVCVIVAVGGADGVEHPICLAVRYICEGASVTQDLWKQVEEGSQSSPGFRGGEGWVSSLEGWWSGLNVGVPEATVSRGSGCVHSSHSKFMERVLGWGGCKVYPSHASPVVFCNP